ncbi:MAG: toxin [Gammaproteobacteria bacterium]|nr:toxin [Gammaproteobacteria bacterium]
MKIYNWNADKNQDLIVGRGVSFEEAVFYIENGGLLDDITHPNASDYPNQRIFVICIKEYVHLIPYVESDDEVFLKTIIPSRKFTKLYLGGES